MYLIYYNIIVVLVDIIKVQLKLYNRRHYSSERIITVSLAPPTGPILILKLFIYFVTLLLHQDMFLQTDVTSRSSTIPHGALVLHNSCWA